MATSALQKLGLQGRLSGQEQSSPQLGPISPQLGLSTEGERQQCKSAQVIICGERDTEPRERAAVADKQHAQDVRG